MKFKFLATLLVAAPGFIGAQCLNGVYTIGGTTPDYATLTAAINDLNTNGVCGPVTFNIRNGTYNEQVTLDTINGSSALNRVVFQSEALDSSLVNIQFNGTSTDSYVMRLRGASNVTIRHLTFSNNTAAYCGLICLTNDADSIEISHNRMLSATSTSGSSVCSQVYTASANCDSIRMEYNFCSGGTFGISASGDSDMVVRCNKFTGQFGSAVNLRTFKRCIVSDNNMYSTSTAPGYEAIWLYGFSDSLKILRNTIDSPKDGITVDNMSCPVNAPALISCNIVRISGTGFGLRVDDNSYGVHYTYNTVQANGSASVFRAENNIGNIDLRYNILQATGSGFIYFNLFTPIEFNSDYNIIHSAAGPFASIAAVVSTSSLLAWRQQYGLDNNSALSLPQFISANDLHVASDFAMNNYCAWTAEAGTDVDGDVRSLTHPYPGADEFTHGTDTSDAGTLFIRTDRFASCNSTHPVKVTIRNFGSDTLTAVTLNWTINGVPQPQVTWNGALSYWDTVQVLLSNVATASNQTFDIHAWTTLPNGDPDPTLINDTLARGAFYASLSGVYTIGGSAPDFSTVTSAVAALNLRGVCGPVTMSIRLGNYPGKYIIDSIHGSSPINTIRFVSEFGDSSTVRLYSSSASSMTNYVFQLRGTDYITFEDLTIETSATSYSNCFRLHSGATHVTIKNCEITSVNAATTEANGTVILNEDAGGTDDYFTVKNSLVTGGHSGIVMRSSAAERGGLIDNIVFSNQTYASLVLRAQNDCMVNRIVINNPVAGQTRGIWLDQVNDSVTIQNCRIYGNIRDGIMMFNNLTKIVVINNFVSVGSGLAAPPLTHAIGISQSNITYNPDEYLVAFNSLNIYTSSNNGNDAALYLATTTDTIVAVILNNNINCNGAGAGISLAYGAWMGTCNYNNINATKIGINQSNPYTTLGSWQALGYDANSISVNPLFLSVSDLHTYQVALGNAGIAIAGITVDIDGDTRAAAPYIGADEANPILDIAEENFNSLSVFPNPATDACIINLNAERDGDYSIVITDLQGQQVIEIVTQASTGMNTIPVSVTGLSPGMYFIKISNADNYHVAELIVK